MDNLLSILLRWIHLLATVAWIGGMLTNFIIYIPAMGKTLEPPQAGKLMAAVMKRFRIMVYLSMIVFLISGSLLGHLHLASDVPVSSRNALVGILIIKIPVFIVMVILAIVAFEFLAPKVAKLAAQGPSPKLQKAQRNQKILALTGFLLGLIILAISSVL